MTTNRHLERAKESVKKASDAFIDVYKELTAEDDPDADFLASFVLSNVAQAEALVAIAEKLEGIEEQLIVANNRDGWMASK